MGRVNVPVLIFQGLREPRLLAKVTQLGSVGAGTAILAFLTHCVMLLAGLGWGEGVAGKIHLPSLIMSYSTR